MPYAINQGIRIHYEIDGDGPPLVLQHGLGGSLKSWRDLGYAEALKKDYLLILIDARGHGASDKPHDVESYGAKLRAADVVAVMDDINASRAHYFGYSMGGRIGFALARYAPDRFHSLILGGSSPYLGEAEDKALEVIRRRLEAGPEATIAYRERSLGRPLTPEEKTGVLETDSKALLAALEAARLDNPEGVLPTMTMPCLLFAGDADPRFAGVKKAVSHMPNATFVSLPGIDHGQGSTRSDLVLPHITDFLVNVSAALV